MIDWPAVLVVFTIYIAGVVIPGPNFVAVTHTAISSTRKHALALVAGIVLVNLFWASSAIIGLGVVFKLFPWVAFFAKAIGALYLIWFGVRLIIRAKINSASTNQVAKQSVKSAFINGVDC